MASRVRPVMDRILMPALALVAGTVLIVLGHADVGLLLVAAGTGIALPDRLSGLKPRRAPTGSWSWSTDSTSSFDGGTTTTGFKAEDPNVPGDHPSEAWRSDFDRKAFVGRLRTAARSRHDREALERLLRRLDA